MALKVTEVFTPAAFPTHTYVERAADGFEQSLRDALDTQGQLISISGPSKSGKTVLVERVVGRENLITVTGAGIRDPEDVWNRVLDWMDVPHSKSSASATTGTVGAEAGVEGSAKIPGLVSTKGSVKGSVEVEQSREKASSFQRRGLQQVVTEIANSDYTILIDDFHYMPREIQSEVAKILKEAVRLGVRVCAAAVRHRGDDVVRANPELRGRIRSINLNYWKEEDLRQIARNGFEALNAKLPEAAIQQFVRESAGSPQLMQLICLNSCFVTGVREKTFLCKSVSVPEEVLKQVFEQTSANTDFRSLVDVLDAGPKTRGTERKMYRFSDETEGDVYRAILRATASDPPMVSFDYDELTRRVAIVCSPDPPVGSSVVGTCLHMSRLAQEKFPNERAIDWDEEKQILDIPDPYLLFYLRWSGRLQEQ